MSTLFFNNDFYNSLAWIKSLKELGLNGFYDRDFSPWASANYPPLINLFYLFGDNLAHYLFGGNIPLNILASFYKLPSLILETALITYLFFQGQKLMSTIIALNPAIFYNTVFWGQTEGAVTSLVFFSLISLFKKKIILGIILFALSLMVKQSAIVFFPVIAFLIIKKAHLKQVAGGVLLSTILIWLLFLPFHNNVWDFYPVKFFLGTIGGQPHQYVASANALNLWYILGFNQVSDSMTFIFFSQRLWGELMVSIFIGVIWVKLFKRPSPANFLVAAGLINLAVFLFMTRIHERHLFPTLFFLLPLAVKNRLSMLAYLLISLVSFANLFWVWYFDSQLNKSPYLNNFTLDFLAIINLVCFGYFLFSYLYSTNTELKQIMIN